MKLQNLRSRSLPDGFPANTTVAVLAGLVLLTLPALYAGDCGTTLDIESVTEYYVSTTDILQTAIPDIPGPLGPFIPGNPLKIPGNIIRIPSIFEAFNNNCATLDWFSGGVTFSSGAGAAPGSSGNSSISFSVSASAAASGVMKLPFSPINGVGDLFTPKLKPCGGEPFLSLAHIGGDFSGYVFDFGLGAYPRRKTKGHLHLCRDLVVENASGSEIELPLSVAGSLIASGGITADNASGKKNYAKLWLRISGSVAGQGVSEKAELNATGSELAATPEKSINTTRRVVIAPGAGTFPVQIDLDCEGYLEIQAHSAALWGFAADAVTAQVQFPSSIDIGLPTGPNGSPLPPGVRIYDAADGSVYADTTANPISLVPVPGMTHIWDFSKPFNTWLGPLVPAAYTETTNRTTTVLSLPGMTAGMVRRSDADADPLVSVTNHNAFRLSYTVADTNTTPALTVFIYDQPGGTPRALAYDLPLTPGYHEATLRYANGDASGRGIFAPGAPDLARLHSIGIANTVLTDWPAQSALVTTGQLAITFHHLAAFTAPPPGSEGFAITNHYLASDGTFHLGYPSNTNDYYLLYGGSQVTAVNNPFAMALGVDGPGEFQLASTLPSAFFRLREVPRAQPLDVDGDGFDDIFEFLNQPPFNPFVPNSTIVTNLPPKPEGTNAPSNSGQIYLWTLNNHRYLPVLVTNGVTWDEANAAATAVGGYLATISSGAENDFVFGLIDRPEYWRTWPTNPPAASGPWLGGWQPAGAAEPAGGWRWLTPEPLDFTAWMPGAPDNAASPFGANEDRLAFASATANTRSNRWNDLPGALRLPGYVIEFDPPATGGDCIPRDGLVAWWKGDGNALDSAGTNDGVLMNGGSFTQGISGQAFNLDGVNDYVQIPQNLALFPGSNSFTITAWISTTDSTNLQVVFAKYEGAWQQFGNSAIDLRVSGGKISGYLRDTDAGGSGPYEGQEILGHSTVADGQLHSITFQRDMEQQKVRVFVDAVLDAEVALDPGVTGPILNDDNESDPFWIGCTTAYLSTVTQNHFKGRIDEVAFFHRALSADEIAGIYSGGITGRCKPQCVEPPAGLVAWWPADGNALDRLGTDHGTLQGGATFAPGIAAQAFTLDGVDDDVLIPSSSTLNVGAGDGLTVGTWINPADITSARPIVEWGDATNTGVQLWIAVRLDGGSDGSLFANVVGPDASHYFSSAPGLLVANVYQHVALTYNRLNGDARIYLNGSVVASTNLGLFFPRTTNDLHFGARITTHAAYYGRRFFGKMDEITIFNRALTAGEIAGIYMAGSAGFCKKPDCPQAPTNLVAWWPADGNALDRVGTNHGTLKGGATFAPGIAGQAFSLDGTNGYVRVPNSPALNPGSAFTVQAWVHAYSVNAPYNKAILWKGDSTGHNAASPYGLSFGSNNTFLFSIGNGSTYDLVTSSVGISPNGWHHIAAVASGTVLSVYVDGLLAGTNAQTIVPSSSSYDLQIGAVAESAYPYHDYFDGLIDDVMIFNRALSASEIQSLYQSVTLPPVGPVVDQGGTNWTVTAGTVLSGAYVNLGEFVIPRGVTANVASFDGTNSGWAEIRARTIRVDGTLDATGKGYPGGGGGGGGGGADQLAVNGGKPGQGASGGSDYLGSVHGEAGADGGEITGGRGGRGGLGLLDQLALYPGTGAVRGEGASNSTDNNAGHNGTDGGYFAPATNGDTTVGDEVVPGCGGGGGSGGGGGHSRDVNSGGGGGGGGGSGGLGGGAIILRAEQTLEVSGALLAPGTRGTDGAMGKAGHAFNDETFNSPGWISPGGNGGPGAAAGAIGTSLGGLGGVGARDTVGAQSGHESGVGGRGGNGGAGAGGGILLRAPQVTVTGTINNAGGSSTNNGGTVKIFRQCNAPAASGHITAGRLLEQAILMRSPTVP